VEGDGAVDAVEENAVGVFAAGVVEEVVALVFQPIVAVDANEHAVFVVERMIEAADGGPVVFHGAAGDEVVVAAIGGARLVGQRVKGQDVLGDGIDAVCGNDVPWEGLAAESAVGCGGDGGGIVDLVGGTEFEEVGEITGLPVGAGHGGSHGA